MVKQRHGLGDDRQLDGSALEEVCVSFCRIIEDKTGTPVPDDPHQQLEMAVIAVLKSWNSSRATEYRRINDIANGMGTAVNVVAMVYGNRDEKSGTGVVFSCNVVTGSRGIWGEYLANAQGEDVVAGTHTPLPIDSLRASMPPVYERLANIVEMLEARRGHVVDIEFTIESGALYILQVRKAKLTPEAAVTIAAQSVFDKKTTKAQALKSVTPQQIETVRAPTFEPSALQRALGADLLLARGLSASSGCAVGRVALTSDEAVSLAKLGEKIVLVRRDTCPDDLDGMLAAAGLVTTTGGYTSHAAVVARDLGKPCIVAASVEQERSTELWHGRTISMDGQSAVVISGPVALAGAVEKKEVSLFLKWARQAELRQWPKPRLAFDYYYNSISIHTMIYEYYLCDAMYSASKNSKLESKARTLRRQVHTQVAERIALYLFVACAGEIRHLGDRECYWTTVVEEVNSLRLEFQIVLSGSRERAEKAILNQLKSAGLPEQIRYLELVLSVFSKGRWTSAFGGEKWANIAQSVLRFLKGEYSHSIFADHAFDLQHNTGCVFGKNPMIYGAGHEVHRQLETKKETRSVGELYGRFHRWKGDSDRNPLSKVERLYREGEQLRLWETENESRAVDLQYGSGFSGPLFPELPDDLLAALAGKIVPKGMPIDESVPSQHSKNQSKNCGEHHTSSMDDYYQLIKLKYLPLSHTYLQDSVAKSHTPSHSIVLPDVHIGEQPTKDHELLKNGGSSDADQYPLHMKELSGASSSQTIKRLSRKSKKG